MKLMQGMDIALPGSNVGSRFILHHHPRDRSSFLTVKWKTLKIPKGFRIQKHSKNCYFTERECLILNSELPAQSNITYFIIGNISEYFAKHQRAMHKSKKHFLAKKVIPKKRWNAKISWNDAAEICKSINAYLPHFTSRDDLDEFLMLIKTSMDLPIMKAVFIGLALNTNKVGMSEIKC